MKQQERHNREDNGRTFRQHRRMNLHLLPHLTIETAPEPDAAIIWLHGLGADGHDFEPIVAQLGLNKDTRIRFIFPHAPAIPVSINGGYVMPAWYDIRENNLGVEHDAAGIANSEQAISLLIEQQQMHGIATHRIILAGFSQGAAMALHVGLQQSEALAGIIVLSGYLLLPDTLQDRVHENATQSPIWMAHGINDPVVPFELGETACDKLRELNIDTLWHSYPMAHQVCPQEISALGKWLNTRL
ncbi:MAG: dienelactone hydrolase family protein [Mariprofundaceae bacterium]